MSNDSVTLTSRTDEDLAAIALEDPAAFEELYRRYQAVAMRMARRMGTRVPRLDVGDAAALAMTKLWAGLGAYDPARPFAPWATVVMSRAVKTAAAAAMATKNSFNWWAMLYRGDRDASEGSHPLLDHVADERSATDAALLLTEEEALVSSVLDEVLSDHEAKVMRLRLSGWSYAEIAVRLGVDDKSVDNAVRRATAKLRKVAPARGGDDQEGTRQ